MRKRIQRAPQLLVSRLEEAGISGRVFIVLLALFIAALTLAPPVKNYFVQRAQISALQANVSDNAQQLAAARAELEQDRKSTRLNSSHVSESRMPSSA